MRWRKQYVTAWERKIDMVWGTGLFICVNIPLAILVWFYGLPGTTADIWWQVLPWVVQVLVLGAMLILRPPMIIGYLVGFALTLLFPIVLAVLFLAGCFLFVVGGGILSEIPRGASVPLASPPIFLALLVALILFLLACYLAVKKMITSSQAIEWEEELSHEKDWVPASELTWESDVPRAKGDDDVA